MEKIDLATVIQEAISRCSQNRIGEKPPVFVTLSPALTQVPWQNRTAERFVRHFLYETLMTGDARAAIEVSLRQKLLLNDLNAFLAIHPSYWVQVRVCGRGLRVGERMIEDLFEEVGYRCEEWIGVQNSTARLGVFGAIDPPKVKMVFCLEMERHMLKCDILVPVHDNSAIPYVIADRPPEFCRT